jgi:hypothetical protein
VDRSGPIEKSQPHGWLPHREPLGVVGSEQIGRGDDDRVDRRRRRLPGDQSSTGRPSAPERGSRPSARCEQWSWSGRLASVVVLRKRREHPIIRLT